ncbi:transposon Tf2-1 polyprotein isoform X1 [Cucumis melo var. makuwa]|uniref:Transposon Tf2-1 polyprotein isoform X1 n=1 Tax=Cucumis melo var. makuwa TaxID=1194695 RepID=A0A5A7TF73_CUCMM|nr:transposon Tf2-1 polyprotein isoform X1 [Cucumis melo var. makuwa]TYK25932.1 transposon Tf2-1 polyprotein isoform X1 [Cucumis melo var. makuwa]
MESLEQEIARIKKEMIKMPVIETALIKLSKNMEMMQLLTKKQQQAILSYMEANVKEWSSISERMTESNMQEILAMKSKENEPTSSRNIRETRAEQKTKMDKILGDRNKFNKVEMSVFTDDDPDSWLFRALAGGKYPPQPATNTKASNHQYYNDNERNTSFPIRTITQKSPNVGEVRKEGTSKRQPDVELQLRREKGLCFKCNEKYSNDHKCKMKEKRELKMFVVNSNNEELEIIEEAEVESTESRAVEVQKNTTACVDLSINSVVGLNDPRTMKVRRTQHDQEVVILIDCGATDNFVSEKLSLEVKVSEWTVKEGFLPLELGGVDIILGDSSLTKARVSPKNLMKTWEDHDCGHLIQCRSIEVIDLNELVVEKGIEVEDMGESLMHVLNQFSDVFDWLEKLPPRRSIEHQIHLKDGTNPVNVRPYRYAYHQKEEMEKLVGEMLASGVIKPSARVEYLGHLISEKGVEVDPDKIRSIVEWPKPANVRIENKAADALSSIPPTTQLCNMIAPVFLDLKVIKEEVEKDEKLQKIIAELSGDWAHQDGKFMICSVVGGHFGSLRTYKRIVGELYWQGMQSTIKRYYVDCLVCQRNKTLSLSLAGLLLPLEIPTQVWNHIFMDFVDGLPKAADFEVIFVVVNRLYRDKVFLSNFLRKMFRLAGTKLNRSLAYHPQSDGQTEVRALGMTPFQVVYGRRPTPLLYYGDRATSNVTLDEQLKEQNMILSSLREHLRLAQDQMKKYANQKR